MFALGCLAAREGLAPGAAWCFALCGVFVLGAAGLRGRRLMAMLCGATLALGAGWCSLRLGHSAPDGVDRVVADLSAGTGAPDRGVLASIEGIVLEDPRPFQDATSGLERFLPRRGG